MIIQTGTLLPEILGKPPVTGGKLEHPVHLIHRFPGHKGTGIGTQINPVFPGVLLFSRDLWIGRIGDLDIKVPLVILQQNVVLWLMLLDETAFQHQSLIFGVGDDVVIIIDLGHHFCHLGGMIRRPAEIAGDPLFQILRLADINDLPGLLLHDVYAG